VALKRLTLALALALVASACDGCDCDLDSRVDGDVGSIGAEVGSDGPSSAGLRDGFDVLGIALGAATRAEVIRWTEALGIPCSEGVDVNSGSTVFECRAGAGSIPSDHTGEVVRVIVEIRSDDVLVSLSVRRRHATTSAGRGDYEGTRGSMSPVLGGAPTVTGSFEVEDGTTEPARETSAWATTAVAAELELLRGMGPDVMVTEEWRWRAPPE
jgi:hypothetical protein